MSWPDPLRVELGGGPHPCEGFVNVDWAHATDKRCKIDLQREPLPFPDQSVAELYAAHVFEHLDPFNFVLCEIVRVCRLGTRVEIRSPHWLSQMAMCGGHKHVISPRQVANWVGPWCHDWFPQCARRLKLVSEEHMPETAIEEARTLHTGWSDEQLMRFVPGCAHESRYVFEVVSNE